MPATEIVGRRATSPANIPRRGWWQVLVRVAQQSREDNVPMVAAGCAFFSLLSAFPAIFTIILIYSMILDPAGVEHQFEALGGFIPEQITDPVGAQLQDIASQSRQELGWSLVLTFAFTLWTASAGMKAMFSAMNVAYEERETRNPLVFHSLGVALTLLGLVTITIMLVLIVGVPTVMARIGLGEFTLWIINFLRWPALMLLMIVALAVIYRFGPARKGARLQWVSWGAVLATVIWMVASFAFSTFVANFATFNKTYGSLGAAVVLLLWFFLTSFAVLLGAELNSELEMQTERDTTSGPEQPMGERGAVVADNVAPRNKPSS